MEENERNERNCNEKKNARRESIRTVLNNIRRYISVPINKWKTDIRENDMEVTWNETEKKYRVLLMEQMDQMEKDAGGMLMGKMLWARKMHVK